MKSMIVAENAENSCFPHHSIFIFSLITKILLFIFFTLVIQTNGLMNKFYSELFKKDR